MPTWKSKDEVEPEQTHTTLHVNLGEVAPGVQRLAAITDLIGIVTMISSRIAEGEKPWEIFGIEEGQYLIYVNLILQVVTSRHDGLANEELQDGLAALLAMGLTIGAMHERLNRETNQKKDEEKEEPDANQN